MASTDISPHLNYMTDAAHLLAFTAPGTSAFLMRQRSELMFVNELNPAETQRQHVCGACGHIMILGQNSTLKLETEKAVRSKQKPKNGQKLQRKAGPSKVFTCDSCGRYTKAQLPPPAPISRKKPLPVSVSSKAEPIAKQLPSANASSKKRAKNRKAGLQALLSQSGGAKSGLGLSLSDFMKR
jgi:hypothetical protein